ncbi:MAG: hypothetical protein OZ921_13560 [Sorangiineae bacterium]|nr:hypothetical protein [Polyangiaceae bacterium]MEB2323533.1 hypothetical protein [Sorangiineae bacterium]
MALRSRRVSAALVALGLAACAVGSEDGEAYTAPRDGGADVVEAGASSGGSAGSQPWPGGGASGGGGAGFGGASGAGAAGGSGAAGSSGGAASGGSSGAGGGVCTPGLIDDVGPCARCGSLRRTCDSAGQWGPAECVNQGVCDPNASDSQPCGSCGTQSRTCSASCQWGAWGGCGNGGSCNPGDTQSRPCGNCGTQTRSCDGGCGWGSWSGCTGEGECVPDSTRAAACDKCSEQVCTKQCQWSSTCTLKPTSTCEWRSGTHWECCAAGSWHFCLPDTCQWSPTCAGCSGCGC